MTDDRQFAMKYGFPFFDAFQDENVFKHSARNKQQAELAEASPDDLSANLQKTNHDNQ